MRQLKRTLFKIAEHKQNVQEIYFDEIIHPTFANPIVEQITPIVAGAGQAARIGTKITGTFLTVRFSWTSHGINVATASYAIIYRLICFIWKDDTAPTVDDLLVTPFNTGSQFPDHPYDSNFKVKSKVLWDVTWPVYSFYTSTSVNAVERPNGHMMFKTNLKNFKRGLNVINYQTAATDTGVNNIWIMALSSNTNANQGWNLDIRTDYRYIDM